MSTILKALRRVEGEQGARSLREQVVGAPVAARAWPAWLVPAGALAAGVAIGTSALLLWPGGSAEPAAPAEAGVRALAAARPAPDSGAGPKPPAAPEPAALGPEAAPQPPPPDERRALPEPAPPAELPAAALVSEVEVVERVAAAPRPAAEEPPAERPPARAAPRPALPPPPVPTGVASKPEPELPVAASRRVVRTPLPELFVRKTIWHPRSERREAVVEMAGRAEPLHLREGDAVGPLVVGRIEPSGVVFVHQGVELRQRVGARP